MTKFLPIFLFMNEEVTLIEIKREDMPEDSTPDQLYHWLSMSKSNPKLTRLNFIEMGKEMVNGNEINVRKFENGELRFDSNFAKFLLIKISQFLVI